MTRTFGRLARAALDLGAATDAELLADFVARRDDAAFAALVRRHASMVLAVCRRVLRHQQDAEDAFQATFLVLARKAEDVWPRDAVGAWLHGVAYRVAMKARGVRARQTRREHPLQDLPHLPPESSPDLAEVLDRAIRTLPEAYRAAVVACDLEGRTRKDAAAQLGWKEGTLSGRLARARQLLATRLKKSGLVGMGLTPTVAEAVPARLVDTVVRASTSSAAAGVSAPVAALTEGVVRSMFLVKIKSFAAVVLAASVLGLGVWSASGQGPGAGTGERLVGRGPVSATPAEPSDLDRLQGEWIISKRFIDAAAKPPREVIDAIVTAAKKDGSLVTIDGTKLDFPFVTMGVDGVLRVEPKWHTIKLDPTQSPKHIDLTDEKGRVTQGIYKFEDGYFMYYFDHIGGRPKAFDEVRNNKAAVVQTLWQPRPPQQKVVAVPPAPRTELAGLELDVMLQEIASLLKQKNLDAHAVESAFQRLHARADIARSLLGRPAPPPKPDPADAEQKERIEWARRMIKQGFMSQQQLEWEIRAKDPDATALQGKWRIDRIWDHMGRPVSLQIAESPTHVEFTGKKLLMPYLDASTGAKTVVFTFAVDSSKTPKEIDLIASDKPIGKGVYELGTSPGAVTLRLTVGADGKRPAKPDPRGQTGVLTLELSRPHRAAAPSPEFLRMMDQVSQMTAQKNVDEATADIRKAAMALEKAALKTNEFAEMQKQAQAELAAARAKLDEAKRAADKVRAATNVPPSFTLHVRTPLAAETAESVSLAASMTVLDVFDTYKTLNDLRRKGGLSVWVVRDEKVMMVDIDAITKDGKTATNYQLKNWDKVFVQVNVGK